MTLLINSASESASCLDNFKDTADALGLRISWPKTKLQNLGAGTQLLTIVVNGKKAWTTLSTLEAFSPPTAILPPRH